MSQKLHSVRTFTQVNRRGCINRDINAAKNMRNLVDHYTLYKDRPKEFTNHPVQPQSTVIGVNCMGARGAITNPKRTIKKNYKTGDNTDDSQLQMPLQKINNTQINRTSNNTDDSHKTSYKIKTIPIKLKTDNIKKANKKTNIIKCHKKSQIKNSLACKVGKFIF